MQRLLPTSGSPDVLGNNPNVIGRKRVDESGVAQPEDVKEKTTSGLGGGAVFTIDGITFGVDICLDHVQGRLKKSNETVQVHLITSCGVSSIDDEQTATVEKGFVFNVDGMAGVAGARLQKQISPQVAPSNCWTASPIGAPAGTPFGGTNWSNYFVKQGKLFVWPRQKREF